MNKKKFTYIKNPNTIILITIPLILKFTFSLYFNPTTIDESIPPTNPPIWAKLSIPVDAKPIKRFMIMIGNICLIIVLPKYILPKLYRTTEI